MTRNLSNFKYSLLTLKSCFHESFRPLRAETCFRFPLYKVQLGSTSLMKNKLVKFPAAIWIWRRHLRGHRWCYEIIIFDQSSPLLFHVNPSSTITTSKTFLVHFFCVNQSPFQGWRGLPRSRSDVWRPRSERFRLFCNSLNSTMPRSGEKLKDRTMSAKRRPKSNKKVDKSRYDLFGSPKPLVLPLGCFVNSLSTRSSVLFSLSWLPATVYYEQY